MNDFLLLAEKGESSILILLHVSASFDVNDNR